jgi:LmbE family N-acetylglucosaminyl deacetylase
MFIYYTKDMKKIIFGVFAHPDDEAFIAAGALLRETRAGAELHLISLTNGSAGANPDNYPNLGLARLKEWQQAGELLGATGMHHLGFIDGELTNKDMIEATRQIKTIIDDVLEGTSEPYEVEILTFDLTGITGHIDHIVASRAASQVFYTSKSTSPSFTRLRYVCLPQKLYPVINTDWIYMDAGRTPEEVSEIIDTRSLRDDILAIMRAHHSQRSDMEAMIKSQGGDLGLYYFIEKR